MFNSPEDIVTNLELSQELRKKNIEDSSLFKWVSSLSGIFKLEENIPGHECVINGHEIKDYRSSVPAYTSQELLRFLPKSWSLSCQGKEWCFKDYRVSVPIKNTRNLADIFAKIILGIL